MEWPWQYNFPPFFTLQPNEDTKRKQFEAWCDLVLAYCQKNRLFKLDLNEAQSSELFNNKKIDRKCSLDLISLIIEELAKRGRAEWLNNESSGGSAKGSRNSMQQQQQQLARKCLILWNTYDEWAKFIYDYVNRKSLQDTVCTFYELTESKDVRNEKFYNIDPIVFRKSLNVLHQQGKAEVFQLDNEGDLGVKFF